MNMVTNILDVDGPAAEVTRFADRARCSQGAPLCFASLVEDAAGLETDHDRVLHRIMEWGAPSEAIGASCEMSPDGGCRYRFGTKGSGVTVWLEKVSPMFPAVRFRYGWYEPLHGKAGWLETTNSVISGEAHVCAHAGSDLWREEARGIFTRAGMDEIMG